MDYRSLTSLLLRLTGVVIMAASAVSVPGTFVSLYLRDVGGGGVNAETWLLTAIAATFPIVIGLLLIYFPARVANKLVAGDGEAADAQRLDAQHLEQIAFSILGLYFIAMAMFDAVYWCAKRASTPFILVDLGLSARRPLLLLDRDFAGVVQTGVQFVIGVLLLFGGRGLANLLRRLRTPPALPDVEPSPTPDAAAGQTRG